MGHRKHDRGKSRLDLVPPRALELVGHLLAHGARVYGEDNWRECKNPSRYVAAGLRHTNKHLRGEFVDPDTNIPHLASVAANALFALELYLMGRQDRVMHDVYLAVIKRKTKKSRKGRVLRRFRGSGAYERAWEWMVHKSWKIHHKGIYTIMTIGHETKVGAAVPVPAGAGS